MPSAINDSDLPSGLEDLAERQEEMKDFTCSFEVADPIPALREEVVSHLYHIASEAVTNAAQHATPSTVIIRLETSDDHLVLSVRDDGAGIPEEIGPSAGVGLHLMEARAGLIGADLEIDAAEGGGTLVRCSLPLGERCEEGG
jgi:signal transduction histidine kinase